MGILQLAMRPASPRGRWSS